MATQTTSKLVQIVGSEEGRDSIVFNKDGLQRLIANYCDEKKTHDYAVFSIVGAQSSGKSTLINTIFGTNFQVMDAKKGRNATTKGIWASICNEHPMVVLDIEGSDGAEQKDGGFQNQSALFALCVSDVIFVNIGITDIGRMNGGSIPLLHNIFQERVNHKMHNTVMVFAVRDYDGETPIEALRDNLESTIHKIYGQFPKEHSATLRRCIELHFEFFRHKKHEMQEFGNNCTEIAHRISRREFVCHGQNKWPIETFPSVAESLWNDILQNKRLDLASYWDIASHKTCKEIMLRKLKSLRSNQDYESLTTGDLKHPRVFCTTLDKILQSILSEYDEEAEHYNIADAEDMRKILKDNILEDAKTAFEKTMKQLVEEFLEDTSKRIKPLLEQNLFENMELIVMENSGRFWNEIKDLDLYNDVATEYHKETKENLMLLTKSVRKKDVEGSFVGPCTKLFYQFAINFITHSMIAALN